MPTTVDLYTSLITAPIKGWLRGVAIEHRSGQTTEYVVESDRDSGAARVLEPRSGKVWAWQPECRRLSYGTDNLPTEGRGYWDRPSTWPIRLLAPLLLPIWGRERQSDRFRPVDIGGSASHISFALQPLDADAAHTGSGVLDTHLQCVTRLDIYDRHYELDELQTADGPIVALST